MPFETGGRADKLGNSYEIDCIIYEMLKVLDEKNYSVCIEPLGIDEIGTDILVTNFDGQKEHQQCKARNASKEYWNISDLKEKNIFSTWKVHLDRDCFRKVALISPIACTFLSDLHDRASNTSGKAEDFYSIQIMKSSKPFQEFYEKFCFEMDLNSDEDDDILKSINYLKRIYYKQISEYQLKEMINLYIQNFFSTKVETVYNAFVSLIVKEDILGKETTQTILMDYLKKQGITFRLQDNDERISPRIQEINQEYRKNFNPLLNGFVHRKVFDDCIEAITNEKSIIISGNAGYGKSGCTEAILNYCEEEKIPHIAIKLDRRTPHKNCKSWGHDLGFPSSIAHSIHWVSRNKNAVIILDQLDALRWTQANSSEALTVCMELIRQVEYLNHERNKKIIIVFVCRTYDLENDNNINSLFKKQDTLKNDWKTIRVDVFEENEVKEIIGKNYENFLPKLKNLLKIPSNLYIWQHLDKNEVYEGCLTTSHLINNWFEQICRKSTTAGLQERAINEVIKRIVDFLDKTGRLYIPKQNLNIEEAELDYLISSEIIILQNNKVSFVHQSILDYFISQSMFEKYFNDSNQPIENIIGEKSKQNPSRRYQVQMFLQNILELDSSDFLLIGEKMLTSNNIRYYVKHIFYEILRQIEEPDENITQFILTNYENNIFGNYLMKNTILGKKQYISILMAHGILERWYLKTEKKDIVFNLLQSITPNFDDEIISFIKKYAFKNMNDDKQFMRCFIHDTTEENEEMFELRMMFYEKYPEYIKEMFIDLKKIMEHFGKRLIQLIAFCLKNKIENYNIYLSSYEELDSNNIFFIENTEYILNELLPYIPKESPLNIKYSNWNEKHINKYGIERTTVKLVKKATIELINKSPQNFWTYYKPYLGKGYHIFNEIILASLSNMPSKYSNQIIDSLIIDFDKNIFDYTSGAEDQLGLTEEILKIHGNTCTKERLSILEDKIYKYISPYAIEWYKQRIEQNKTKKSPPVYWSFWGDLQYKLLQCLPEKKVSKKTKDLLNTLHRRFYKVPLHYSNSNIHSGWVTSPISEKNISKTQWLQIITNSKLKKQKRPKLVEVKDGFIESSSQAYARDFQTVVQQNPQEMIEIILENKECVLPIFIDSLFLGIELSEKLEIIDFTILEKLFLEFPCDIKSYRASYFCGIIKKLKNVSWSPEIIQQLMNIALNHFNPELSSNIANEKDSCQTLRNNALNSVKGRAAMAIGHLLQENKEFFSQFKDIIEKMLTDKNPEVCFAAMYALYPSYNINKEWTEKNILHLYESDIRTTSFFNSNNMLFRLYSTYKEKVIKIVKNCFESEDQELIEIGGHTICEFYIHFKEFEKIVLSVEDKSEDQIKSILEMAILYLDISKYKEIAQKIILTYKNTDIDLQFPLSKIFNKRYINSIHDKEFLKELMKSRVSKKLVRAFVNYLEENTNSIILYKDIILRLCENILQMKLEDLKQEWGLENHISKLIIFLYDKTINIDKQTSDKCMDLWDIMFERQLGSVREISQKLMER
ncbi:hypothetical protein KST80_10680 [Fusobacterium polymorphum]|uniref:Novel STAND NTPase 3 domain-containing protein n=1 Tax=Fusobacterium nucleatum subsp. polymorphum TaxID=76857 RepID=A0A2C6AXK7_FUSNP|nr:hypothetical protein [Fusobacterium polymorphum]PHI07108.1 hypothetical protein CBG54_08760 [Fusobacterium polymorphum]PHI16630.1 hypothetical protein CBG58_06270 [Fusobacterium polymorphum]